MYSDYAQNYSLKVTVCSGGWGGVEAEIAQLQQGYLLRGAFKWKKCHKKGEKFIIFLAPPPIPPDDLDFFLFNWNI